MEICSAWEVTGDLPTAKAMLCTADCNKTKAQRLEWLQVRLMRRCNEKCGLGIRYPRAYAVISSALADHNQGCARGAPPVCACCWHSLKWIASPSDRQHAPERPSVWGFFLMLAREGKLQGLLRRPRLCVCSRLMPDPRALSART